MPDLSLCQRRSHIDHREVREIPTIELVDRYLPRIQCTVVPAECHVCLLAAAFTKAASIYNLGIYIVIHIHGKRSVLEHAERSEQVETQQVPT